MTKYHFLYYVDLLLYVLATKVFLTAAVFAISPLTPKSVIFISPPLFNKIFCDAFYKDAYLSFILEYMDLGTIADIIERSGPIPERILAKISREVLLGLGYLHKMHVIHRDIKPQNILLNSSGEIKITDFGVSGEIAHTASFARTFVGTIQYMSPARIKGALHSTKSDIWSLGLVILECALGKYPYNSQEENRTFFFRF